MKTKAFSLAEMLIVILLMSVAMVVMAPVMTKKVKEPPPQVKIVGGMGDGVPVGTIVLFYGDNIPEGWQECSGQSLSTHGFEELAISVNHYGNLPDLNKVFQNTDLNIKWIIKVSK